MNKLRIYVLGFFLLALKAGSTQDLLDFLDSTSEPQKTFVEGTFRSVRMVNGYSSETAGKKDLVFSITHRFGPVNGGSYEFFGLDEANIRLGFEYGFTDRFSAGLGRSSYEKLYDGFVKYKIVKQSTGSNSFPLTLTLKEGMEIKTLKWANPELNYPPTARYTYSHTLFIARKFNKKFSAQIVPVVVHRNMVDSAANQNVVVAIGVGANYTVNHWLSFSGEYYQLLPGNTADLFNNSLAFGMDIESGGGHLFQIQVSNSRGMTEKQFVPQTYGDWLEGDFRIGFNLIRVFHLKKKKHAPKK